MQCCSPPPPPGGADTLPSCCAAFHQLSFPLRKRDKKLPTIPFSALPFLFPTVLPPCIFEVRSEHCRRDNSNQKRRKKQAAAVLNSFCLKEKKINAGNRDLASIFLKKNCVLLCCRNRRSLSVLCTFPPFLFLVTCLWEFKGLACFYCRERRGSMCLALPKKRNVPKRISDRSYARNTFSHTHTHFPLRSHPKLISVVSARLVFPDDTSMN